MKNGLLALVGVAQIAIKDIASKRKKAPQGRTLRAF
jgi:hypothetical protein